MSVGIVGFRTQEVNAVARELKRANISVSILSPTSIMKTEHYNSFDLLYVMADLVERPRLLDTKRSRATQTAEFYDRCKLYSENVWPDVALNLLVASKAYAKDLTAFMLSDTTYVDSTAEPFTTTGCAQIRIKPGFHSDGRGHRVVTAEQLKKESVMHGSIVQPNLNDFIEYKFPVLNGSLVRYTKHLDALANYEICEQFAEEVLPAVKRSIFAMCSEPTAWRLDIGFSDTHGPFINEIETVGASYQVTTAATNQKINFVPTMAKCVASHIVKTLTTGDACRCVG